MSAVLGVFGPWAAIADAGAMLNAMARRGTDLSANWHRHGAILAVARYGWELSADFSDGTMVVEASGLVVAADATLYERAALLARLRDRSVIPGGTSPSHLIAAAYRAWGPQCTEYLHGDYAFVVWDPRTVTMCAARSVGGKRPLFLARQSDSILVASTIGGALAHPAVSPAIDAPAVAAAACGLVTVGGPDTAYEDVKRVATGETLTWHDGELRSVGPWSVPPIGGVTAKADLGHGAHDLRNRLEHAVAERLASESTTALWLSGGWDSSAVWGIGQHLLRNDPRRQMVAVSISYPRGDLGREDEFIASSVQQWDGDVNWLHIDQIPLFLNPETGAASRDEPFAHMFEYWNRSLAHRSREAGARVALDGFGGDQLFQVSESYLIDLWRRGQWLEALKDWIARRAGGPRRMFHNVVRPARSLRGRPVPWAHLLLRPLPPWLRSDFVARYDLVDRQRDYLPSEIVGDLSEGETRFLLESPFYYLVNQIISEFCLEHGVESRSPLFDHRIVRFAVGRPRRERASAAETKRLLRHAVRGLLPKHVLAPRRTRTGITSTYALQWMGQPFQSIVGSVLRTPWVLEELGIIDAQRFRAAITPARLAEDGNLRVSAFLTLQAELWLRSRTGRSNSAARRVIGSVKEPSGVPRSQGSWAAPSQSLGTI